MLDKRIDSLIITRNGENSDFKSLKSNDVLLLQKSGDGTYLKIDASSETLSDVIEEMEKNENDRIKVSIGGKSYMVSPHANSDFLSLGEKLTFHFDANKSISLIDKYIPIANEYRYLFSAKIDGFNSSVKLFTVSSSGKKDTINIDNKITVNNTIGVSPSRLMDILRGNGDKVVPQLIIVKYAGEGKVSDLYTVSGETEYLTTSFPESIKTYSAPQKMLGMYEQNGYFIDPNTVIFYVDNSSVDDCGVKAIGDLVDKQAYTVTGYNANDRLTVGCLVLNFGSGGSGVLGIDYNTKIGIVENIYTTIRSDTIVNGLSLYSNGVLMKLACDLKVKVLQGASIVANQTPMDLSAIKPGDIIFYSVNYNGNLDTICRIFPITSVPPYYTDEKDWLVIGSHGYSTEQGLGTVSMKYDDIIKVTFDTSSVAIYTYLAAGATVVLNDRNDDKIRMGTINDIEVGDRIYLRANSGSVNSIFIIRQKK
jgi:hypothetical protein